MGAYGGRADLMDLVSPAGPVYQAGTLSGNPLAMTAGLWSLKPLKPVFYARLGKLGTRLAAGLADAARGSGVALQVNAVGSVLTPFFTARPVRDASSVTVTPAALASAIDAVKRERRLAVPVRGGSVAERLAEVLVRGENRAIGRDLDDGRRAAARGPF